MGFAVGGEEVVRPCRLAAGGLDCVACRCNGFGSAIPIFGRIGNSPHVRVVVECDSNQEILTVIAQRQASCHAGGSASATQQIVQQYWSFERQGLGCADSAALRAYHQSYTLRG